MRVREHAEEIAFYDGGPKEHKQTQTFLSEAISVGLAKLWATAQLDVFQNAFSYLTIVSIIYTHIYMYVYIHVYIYMFSYIYIYIYIYITISVGLARLWATAQLDVFQNAFSYLTIVSA